MAELVNLFTPPTEEDLAMELIASTDIGGCGPELQAGKLVVGRWAARKIMQRLADAKWAITKP